MAKTLRLEDMTLADALEPLPVTLDEGATLAAALGKMKAHSLHELAVLDTRGALVGVLSDETLLKRRRLPLTTLVSNLLVVPPRLTVGDAVSRGAEALLGNGFRELPIFEADGKRLAGQVSRWGLLRLLRQDREICALPAHAIMTPDPVVVKERDTIDHAIDEMRRLDEPTIPVVDDDGGLTGVVSARDILRLYAGWTAQSHVPKGSPKRQEHTRLTVSGVMTTPVVEASREATVGELIDLMLDSKASSVVIAKDGKPAGIVTKGDLLEMLASFAPREGVFLQVSGLEGHDPFLVEDVFALIEPTMKRLAAHVRPNTFNLHVMEHRRAYGHRAEVRARLLTDRGLFTASDEADDLMRAVAGVLDRIEKQVVREIDRRRPSPRKARAGVPPPGRAKVV